VATGPEAALALIEQKWQLAFLQGAAGRVIETDQTSSRKAAF